MFVIRRVYEVKPGMARAFATVARRQADAYETSGQRSATQIYFNGGTTPGEVDRVYMEWTADVLESVYRQGNIVPQSAIDASQPGQDMTVRTWIEFYELMTPAKMVTDV
jgi:hypothetical protein